MGLEMIVPDWNLLISMTIFFYRCHFKLLTTRLDATNVAKLAYEHVLSEMFEEIRQIGVKKWEKETSTQAELLTA